MTLFATSVKVLCSGSCCSHVKTLDKYHKKTFSTKPFFTKKDFRTDTLLIIFSKFPEILFSKRPLDPCFAVYFIFCTHFSSLDLRMFEFYACIFENNVNSLYNFLQSRRVNPCLVSRIGISVSQDSLTII